MHKLVQMAVALAALCVAVSGCVAMKEEDAGPYPSNYKELLRANIRQSFFDPYSMRDVAVSPPQTGHLLFTVGWVVCLQANAKNRMGGYTGLQRTAFLIKNGAIVNSMPRAPMCESVTVLPFNVESA